MNQAKKLNVTLNKKLKPKMLFAFIIYNIILSVLLTPFVLFWGPFQALKVIAVSSVENSRHPQFVRFFLTEEEINQTMHTYDNNASSNSNIDRQTSTSNSTDDITIEDIQGKNYYGLTYKGKVMVVKDPKRVKVAVTNQLGIAGERVTALVSDAHAVAGINAGAFYDPDGKGNGAFPDGITVHNGQIVHNNVDNKTQSIIGFDEKGQLNLEDLNVDQVITKGIQEAVTFYPFLIKGGNLLITGDGGWGMAPRTGIGQTADGTVIFVVIDGRQPLWSNGAALSDLMNVFKDYHAVNAVNLDGGSSSELVCDGEVKNKLCDIFGERYIPTAFVVMPK
ncbi:phosphodiester glycosidase family protein [Desulfosporosinus sp. SB140]|uniref:phosphodiester glycosidase family protein n=1 Tax=Desulfosporosinus paludis TaxID=3115649 RepID=UPI00388FB148